MTVGGAPLPPGPEGHWLLGTLPRWRRGLLPALQDMQAEYGDAVRYRYLGDTYAYVFTHPDHLQRLLVDNHTNYQKAHTLYALLRPLLGWGLLTADEEQWRRHRRLAQPAFHRERIARLGELMTASAQGAVVRWAPAAAKGAVVHVDRELARLTLEIVGKALFGSDVEPSTERALAAYTDVSHAFSSILVNPLRQVAVRLPFLPMTRRMRAGVARLDAVVDGIVAGRGTAAPRDDLLEMLLAARDADTDAPLTPREIRDEVMTLLFAGHETTACALTWTLYLLAAHPEVEAQVRAELAAALDGRALSVDTLRALPYMHMVVQESLRLYPPVWAFPRLSRAPDVIGGFAVEARAEIAICPYLTHRHPDFWPDPERFDPERFTPDRIAMRHRFAYLPFSAGARQCIGSVFALTEMQLVLATVLQAYRFELMPGYTPAPEPRLTLRPRGGMPMRIRRADTRPANGAAAPRAAAAAAGVR